MCHYKELWFWIKNRGKISSIPTGRSEGARISSSMPSRPWADTPADLLWLIIQRLPTADYIRFGAVCVWWRSVLSEHRRPPAPQIPFLLLSHHDSTFHFLNPPDNKRHRVHLPDTAPPYRFIASSAGWFITALSESSPLLLYNPFSPSTHLLLPSVTSLRPVSTNPTLLCNTGLIHREDTPRDFFRKLVISSSPPATAAVICKCSKRLAFARVGDRWWTVRLTSNSLNVSDIIFSEGTLYAVYYFGRVVAIDLSDLSRPRVTFNVPPPSGGSSVGMYKHSHNYLVMSSRGELLQVLRWMEFRGLCLTTRLVRIFKMVDAGERSWVEVEGLGDDVLFLGHGSHGQSLALSAEDFPEVRRNCVYFTDNHQMYESGESKCELGVYNMEDKSFEPYYPCEYQTSRLPVWFSPIAAAAPQQQG